MTTALNLVCGRGMGVEDLVQRTFMCGSTRMNGSNQTKEIEGIGNHVKNIFDELSLTFFLVSSKTKINGASHLGPLKQS
jgi:hypothetical protein